MRPRPLRSPAGAPRWLTPTDRLVACHASIGAHALAMGLGPWLAAEIPHLVDSGMIVHKG